MLRVAKPKTQRGKRALEDREPKLVENDKKAMFVKGGKCSQEVTQILKELYMLKKPLALMYYKKNFTRPFEDPTSLEFFAKKSDASLFMFGSHSKKRPKNLIMGRTFDYHILDMVEFGVENYVSLKDFAMGKLSLGTKPVLLFHGDLFEQDSDMLRIKSLLTDFFRGPTIEKVSMTGMEHVLSFTAIQDKIIIRSYRVELKKSRTSPYVELKEMGPALDLSIRRKHLASDDLFKKACKKPKELQPKKRKNVSRDAFGSKLGRIHMQPQDVANMPVRRVKALRNSKKSPKDATKETTKGTKDTTKGTKETTKGTKDMTKGTKDSSQPPKKKQRLE